MEKKSEPEFLKENYQNHFSKLFLKCLNPFVRLIEHNKERLLLLAESKKN